MICVIFVIFLTSGDLLNWKKWHTGYSCSGGRFHWFLYDFFFGFGLLVRTVQTDGQDAQCGTTGRPNNNISYNSCDVHRRTECCQMKSALYIHLNISPCYCGHRLSMLFNAAAAESRYSRCLIYKDTRHAWSASAMEHYRFYVWYDI